MALPTAQLGQMASLNVPTSRPVAYTQKNPKLWEQALMQIITGAAMEAGKTGVQNVMSQEFAPEFGQTPATTLKRMLQGPAVDRQTAGQMRAEIGANKRQKVSGEQAMTLEDIRANNDMRRQKEAQTFTGGENKENRVADMLRLLTSEAGATGRQQASETAAEARLRRQLEAEAATQAAHSRLYNTQADQIQQMVDQMKRYMTKPESTTPPTAPTRAPTPPPTPSRSSEIQKFVSDLLAEGVTPEDIAKNLQLPSAPSAVTPPAPVDPVDQVMRQIVLRQQQDVVNNPNIIPMFRGFGPR